MKSSPELFFATVNAYQQSAALKAAIELDLFTAVGSTDGTVGPVARQIGASPRGTRILCDYLTIIGFLRKSLSICRNGRLKSERQPADMPDGALS